MEMTVLIAGFGGQGVLSAGKFVATAALMEGREVSWLPSYGPEMRGGTANCSIILSDQSIGSPILNQTDVLIALNNPSLDKFSPMVKSGGLIIVDESLVKSVPNRQDVRLIAIPASDMASEAGNMTFATVILLGAFSACTSSIQRETFEKALLESLPERHHHLIPQEMDLFDQGAAYAGQS
ncbi:MAG: 2-oxoacid:ferredoxin oxidoreductase subunit gamma [Clostridiaceae bacterium]|jgi:2-oxoglutarate ferredoxin oxidoreductase subunit gamma|nr:2-oxoacid:ferredoxin oxidoreductase subunit gamma [Clostridiaceae bacterium]